MQRTLVEKLEAVERSLKRWHTKLTRASNEVAKLEKKRRRLMLQMLPSAAKLLPELKTTAVATVTVTPLPEMPPPAELKVEEDLKVPKFLSRNPDEGTEIAKKKSDAGIDKKKMPLSGRAAMAAIAEQSKRVTARRAKKELRPRT